MSFEQEAHLSFDEFKFNLKNKLSDIIYVVKEKISPLEEKFSSLAPNTRRIIIIASSIAVFFIISIAIKNIFFGAKTAKSSGSELPQVRVIKTQIKDFTDNYTVMGTIKGAVENELRFEIDGVLASFNYKEGAKIEKGKIICSLDPKDSFTKADYARSKYSSEKSSYYSAVQRLKVYEELFKMKAIAESKIEEARYETLSAESRMKAASSELELAQSNLSKTNLLAPSSGLLAEILIRPGEYITPQDVVAKFISGGQTNFEVDVTEKDVSSLKAGQNVKINCDSYPGKDFFGIVSEIAPTVKERTRTTTVKILVPNAEGQLRSGMFGRGSIYTLELKNVILVPSDSIVTLGANVCLLPLIKPDAKVIGEGLIEMRHIKIGDKTSTQQTIVESGLSKDELVVTETQTQLTDGLRVRFSEIVTDSKPAAAEGQE